MTNESEWKEVGQITPEMVGWEVKLLDGWNSVILAKDGESVWIKGRGIVNGDIGWLVRPPAPPKKSLRERIQYLNGLHDDNQTMANLRAIDAIIEYLDEKAEDKE